MWLKKSRKLVTKIKKIECLAHVIPLYLEITAFSVYDQLNNASKGDSDAIEKALLAAFGQIRFAAYEKLDSGRGCRRFLV